MSISEAQYRDMLARTERSKLRQPSNRERCPRCDLHGGHDYIDPHCVLCGGKGTVPKDTDAPESELHDQIEQECRQRGWYYVHSRMDRKTTNAIGVPDFIIAMPGGITLWIECKRKGSKVSPSQLAASAMLRKLGHLSGFCYSFDEFKRFVYDYENAKMVRRSG